MNTTSWENFSDSMDYQSMSQLVPSNIYDTMTDEQLYNTTFYSNQGISDWSYLKEQGTMVRI